MVRRGEGGRSTRVSYREETDSDDEWVVEVDADDDQSDDSDCSRNSTRPKKKTPKRTFESSKGKGGPVKGPKSKIPVSKPAGSKSNAFVKSKLYYDEEDEDYWESSDNEDDDDDHYGSSRKAGKRVVNPSKNPPKVSSITKRTQPGQGRRESFPPVSEMVIESIKALRDHPRKGSTIGSIKGTMAFNWPVNVVAYDKKIKNFILKAVDRGDIVQVRGSGLRGRFSLPGLKVRKKKRKITQKLGKQFDEDEVEYTPIKTARDKDREKNKEELERERLERKMQQEAALAKKADKPKKRAFRKEFYEVEAIRGKKVVKGDTFFLVKFVGWTKPQWEPEAHVKGCEDAMEEFERLEAARRRKEEERRKREEEEGIYEVKRILDVKFHKDKPREFLIRWVGHGPKDDTWEREGSLNCPNLIDKFMTNWEKVSQIEKRRLREAPKPVERLAYASHGSRGSKRRGGFRVTYEGMDK